MGKHPPGTNVGGRSKGCSNPHPPNYVKIARNDKNARIICNKIVQGLSLTQIALDMGASHHSTILMWVAQDPEFAEQYYLAKRAQADHFAEEIIEIADDATNDWMERRGLKVVNYEAVNRSKLRVESRMRLMASYAPKRFGPKTEVTHEVGGSFAEMLMEARSRRVAAIEAPFIDVTPLDADVAPQPSASTVREGK